MHQLDDNMGAASGWELTEEEVSVLANRPVISLWIPCLSLQSQFCPVTQKDRYLNINKYSSRQVHTQLSVTTLTAVTES